MKSWRNFPEWVLGCRDWEFTLTALHTVPSPCVLFTFYKSRVRDVFRVPIKGYRQLFGVHIVGGSFQTRTNAFSSL